VTSTADRPDPDDAEREAAEGAEETEGREREPDPDRLGFRELDEQRAYDEHAQQTGADDDQT
jgi:hypothetical protein